MWFMVKNLYLEEYTPNWLAKFVHSWPHISYKTFTSYNSTFAPYDEKYVETLLFWTGMPIVWLGLCIVALLLFSCCLCLKRNQPVNVRQGIIRLRWWLISFMLLCLTSIGLCFYGNSLTATGVHHYVQAIDDANETIGRIERNSEVIHSDMESVQAASEELENRLTDCTNNATVLGILDALTKDIKSISYKIQSNVSLVDDKLDVGFVNSLVTSSESVQQYHLWGWSIFIGLLCLDIVLCLAVILFTGKSIRGGIILSCILLIIAFTLVWIVIGGELFVTVGLSDFCIEPNRFIYSEGSKARIETDVLQYYLECSSSVPNPFRETFSVANSLTHDARTDIQKIQSLCSDTEIVTGILQTMRNSIDDFEASMDDLKASVNCQILNEDYKRAIFSLCYNTLAGLGYQILFGIILGMLWLIAICQGTLLASRLGRRKMNYEADQEDPFLPPRDGSATLERYSARREQQPSTSGAGHRPTSAVSQSSNALPHFPVIISNRGSSLISQSNITVPDDLPPSYTLAISRDRPNHRGGNRTATDSSDNNRYSGASLV